MTCVLAIGFLASGVGLLTVAVQLVQKGEPGGDGSPTTASRVRIIIITVTVGLAYS